MLKKVRPIVFWAPFLLMLAAVCASVLAPEQFLASMTAINGWTLDKLSWLYSLSTVAFLLTMIGVYFSPLGKVRIGGENAEPLLSRWNWFAIALCTTVAIGILFWASAEPMYHIYGPPESSGIAPNSAEAKRFALSTLYMHWSFTPYAIYSLPALAFALAYYNLGKSYSLGGMLSIILGKRVEGVGGQIVDAMALWALVAGMAASLGTGLLTVVGGLGAIFSIQSSALLLGIVAIAIVTSFIISAATGLMSGIRILSDLNTKFFFALAAFAFLAGPTVYLLSAAVDGLGEYFGTFLQRSLFTGAIAGDKWPQWWSNFYWANWLAWAPITALFLGRLGRGYTVREFIQTTMIAPSLFAIGWMTIFGGLAIHSDGLSKGALKAALDATGAESVVYKLFDFLPFAPVLVVVFVVLSFISFVTASDSNTEAIASMCEDRVAEDTSPTSLPLKVVWGAMIGAIAWFMTASANIDGIKMMSNLGGIPALFIVLGAMLCIWRMASVVSSGKALTQDNLSLPRASLRSGETAPAPGE
ncbi:MAG: BCCT family transporter [Rhizobiaceae bacterium]|nr:BCCT family transporter [Rhizobiaceae bacterium]